jgi:hypothetical protein
MSIFALVILRGSANLAFHYIYASAVAAEGNVSVEVLLPKGGRGLLLSGSGWSAVIRVDADGGARRRFHRGRRRSGGCLAVPIPAVVVLAGPVSDLTGEVDNEL